jgi:hypothetical protein
LRAALSLRPHHALLPALFALALCAAPSAALAEGPSALVVADDGGVDMASVRAMKGLALGQLEKRGKRMVSDPRLEGIKQTGPELQQLVQSLGVERVYVLRVTGRLGHKIPVELEEMTADLKPVYGSSITTTIDEADVIVPRLVDAVVDHKSADDNATMRTVTEREAAPFKKKPGEKYKVVSLPIPIYFGSRPDKSGTQTPLGISLGFMYEIENLRIGLDAQFMEHKGVYVGSVIAEGYFLPFETEISPYIGGGIGYLYTDETGGLGAKVEVGVEFLRLHAFRVMVAVEALIPFYDSTNGRSDLVNQRQYVFPAGVVRFAF